MPSRSGFQLDARGQRMMAKMYDEVARNYSPTKECKDWDASKACGFLEKYSRAFDLLGQKYKEGADQPTLKKCHILYGALCIAYRRYMGFDETALVGELEVPSADLKDLNSKELKKFGDIVAYLRAKTAARMGTQSSTDMSETVDERTERYRDLRVAAEEAMLSEEEPKVWPNIMVDINASDKYGKNIVKQQVKNIKAWKDGGGKPAGVNLTEDEVEQIAYIVEKALIACGKGDIWDKADSSTIDHETRLVTIDWIQSHWVLCWICNLEPIKIESMKRMLSRKSKQMSINETDGFLANQMTLVTNPDCSNILRNMSTNGNARTFYSAPLELTSRFVYRNCVVASGGKDPVCRSPEGRKEAVKHILLVNGWEEKAGFNFDPNLAEAHVANDVYSETEQLMIRGVQGIPQTGCILSMDTNMYWRMVNPKEEKPTPCCFRRNVGINGADEKILDGVVYDPRMFTDSKAFNALCEKAREEFKDKPMDKVFKKASPSLRVPKASKAP